MSTKYDNITVKVGFNSLWMMAHTLGIRAAQVAPLMLAGSSNSKDIYNDVQDAFHALKVASMEVVGNTEAVENAYKLGYEHAVQDAAFRTRFLTNA